MKVIAAALSNEDRIKFNQDATSDKIQQIPITSDYIMNSKNKYFIIDIIEI